MFNSKRHSSKFLRFYISQQDTWFTPFNEFDIREYLMQKAGLVNDEEDLQHQTWNFTHYLVKLGYIEVVDSTEPLSPSSEYRLSIKGYECAHINFFERHPHYTGIVLGAGLSFMFALAGTIVEKVLFSENISLTASKKSKE